MLIELRVRNLAVIEDIALKLEPGFNALSGETGAGKSIIVGALSLLLGERASAESVRPGHPRAVVEGVFDISQEASPRALLEEHGIESEDGLLILRREVAAEGRNRAWVNGAAATAALVGELGRMLVDLHGQHEHQTLLRPEEQRRVLDAFSGGSAIAAEVRQAWEATRSAARELAVLEQRAREIAQRADYLRFQVAEIERAEIREHEEEALAAETSRLAHADELARTSQKLHYELYASEESVSARVAELRRTLQQLVRLDPQLAKYAEQLETALYSLEDVGRELGDYSSGIEHDPRRLEEVQRRQDVLFRIRKKYGPEVSDVLATLEQARTELSALENVEHDRHALMQAQEQAKQRLANASAGLTKARTTAAKKLAREVKALLPDLGMSGDFRVQLEPLAEIGAHGGENVEFLIAVNQGFEPRPLARVASGGELSRVMLALKAILARSDGVPSLVFDEIDVGIGGRIAHQVGAKLRQVAQDHQVFVITHLAQIAARADHHLLVEKQEREGTTLTRVTELQGDARVQELARLLAGDPESAASLEHARELLAEAR